MRANGLHGNPLIVCRAIMGTKDEVIGTKTGANMRCLIAVSSAGGNTRMVAEHLERELRSAGCEVPGVADVAAVSEDETRAADVVLAGFWTDKGDCAPVMASLLETLEGKRVFLFGTAGFGGSPEYFERILGNVRKHLSDSVEYLGGAMCQGKMGAGVRKRYEAMLAENPGDARIQAMIDNFDAALAHPTEEDVARITAAAQRALGV